MFWNRRRLPSVQENQMKQMELLIQQLTSQNQTLHEGYSAVSGQNKTLSDAIVEFCKQLLQRNIQQVMTGGIPKLDPLEMISYTKKEVAKMQLSEQAEMMKLMNQIKLFEGTNQGLQEQVSHLLIREKNLLEARSVPNESAAPAPSPVPAKPQATVIPVEPTVSTPTTTVTEPQIMITPPRVETPTPKPRPTAPSVPDQLIQTVPSIPTIEVRPTIEHEPDIVVDEPITILPPAGTSEPEIVVMAQPGQRPQQQNGQNRNGRRDKQQGKGGKPQQQQPPQNDQQRQQQSQKQQQPQGKNGKGNRPPVVQSQVVHDPVVKTEPKIEIKPALEPAVAQPQNTPNQRAEAGIPGIVVAPTAPSNPPVQPATPASGSGTMHVIDLKNTMDRLNEQDWVILTAIGEKGLSTTKDIQDYCRNEGIPDTPSNRSLTKIRDAGIVSSEKINIGMKWFWAYTLTDLGHRVFIKKTGKNAVESERERMVREHATAAHGYGVLETAHIFSEMEAVLSTTTDRKFNRVVLPSGKGEVIPDVIVTFQSNDKMYVEYDLGHHTQADFEDKCNRLIQLTPDIVYVTADQQGFVTLKGQLEKWLDKRQKQVGQMSQDCSVHLTTLSKLSKGVWEFEWPVPVEEQTNQ